MAAQVAATPTLPIHLEKQVREKLSTLDTAPIRSLTREFLSTPAAPPLPNEDSSFNEKALEFVERQVALFLHPQRAHWQHCVHLFRDPRHTSLATRMAHFLITFSQPHQAQPIPDQVHVWMTVMREEGYWVGAYRFETMQRVHIVGEPVQGNTNNSKENEDEAKGTATRTGVIAVATNHEQTNEEELDLDDPRFPATLQERILRDLIHAKQLLRARTA